MWNWSYWDPTRTKQEEVYFQHFFLMDNKKKRKLSAAERVSSSRRVAEGPRTRLRARLRATGCGRSRDVSGPNAGASLHTGPQTRPSRPTCPWACSSAVLRSETRSLLLFDALWLLPRLPVVTVATSKRSGAPQLDSNRLPWRCLCLEKRPDLFVVVWPGVSPLPNSSRHE